MPEEVEAEQAKANEDVRRLRCARKAVDVELAQCGDYARTRQGLQAQTFH